MRLNYKRTVLVGLAFLSISAFWQLYDAVIPLILKNTFHLGDGVAGVVMAMDNILALFMLPLFGALSDKCGARIGRRMPFILGGTALAAALMLLLPRFDQAGMLTPFFLCLGLLLIAMGTYRSPAVALMPDVTPKPLLSKGNAIINLMGAFGGIFSLVTIKLMVPHSNEAGASYANAFITVAALMAACAAALGLTIRERPLAAMAARLNGPEEAEDGKSAGKLDPDARRSLILILASVSLWFMGYNAVTSAFSKYVQEVWGRGIGDASTCLMVATAGAVVSYIPVGFLSSRWGRKRMIQFGVVLLCACFASGFFFPSFHPALYVLFALVGCAWAMINVNSFPMVAQLSRGGDVGKYTGYYYTFSMAAQILTPILSGFLLEHVGYWTLFPYAAVMVGLAFITISLTRHGDVKPKPPRSKLEAFDVED